MLPVPAVNWWMAMMMQTMMMMIQLQLHVLQKCLMLMLLLMNRHRLQQQNSMFIVASTYNLKYMAMKYKQLLISHN